MSIPLSIIPASKVLDELEVDPDWAALSDAEKLQVLNTATQEVCNEYYDNGRKDYLDTNLTTPLPPDVVAQEKAGFGIAFHAKEIVRREAPHQMAHGPMTSILYFLGIKGNHFDETFHRSKCSHYDFF